MSTYYNEHDPQMAAWLRELIAAGLIAPGDVDERSIEDVIPTDLVGYTQCHFFAGIGVWSYALRSAGWPDSRPVWTGSCPCQPFSTAGKGAGFADERHLWPAFHWLICQLRPDVVFGEQVSSKDGRAWLDLVRADLEGIGYACAPLDLPAASVGAPHIRQRLYWCADAKTPIRRRAVGAQHAGRRLAEVGGRGASNDRSSDARCNQPGEERRDAGEVSGVQEAQREPELCAAVPGRSCNTHDRSGDADRCGFAELEKPNGGAIERNLSSPRRSDAVGRGPTNGFWSDAEWVYSTDGLYRPVGAGIQPLAHGPPARVGRLRGYGNALVAPLAAEFVASYMEAQP